MKALKYIVPLVVFAALVAFFAVGLTRDPREVPSPFIGKPAPQFKLTELAAPERTFGPEDMRGKVWLLNVWASWCVSCRVEHPLLVDMSRRELVPIVGLDYKDQRADGLQWLARHGDPYRLSAYDDEGKVGIDFGVYGVPVIGLDYKDKREDALKLLEQQGNPYTLSAFDADGQVGIDFGVYGVPETFVIDKQGVIRYKQIGPITKEALDKTILPLVRKLNG
jgi:cytochrome c biogenesis protein CcmG, thiol:disulfide interchange protein DsbE